MHSDRGCQCTSGDYAALAAELGATLTLGRKDQCWGTTPSPKAGPPLKNELVYTRPWPTIAGLRTATFELSRAGTTPSFVGAVGLFTNRLDHLHPEHELRRGPGVVGFGPAEPVRNGIWRAWIVAPLGAVYASGPPCLLAEPARTRRLVRKLGAWLIRRRHGETLAMRCPPSASN